MVTAPILRNGFKALFTVLSETPNALESPN